MAIRPASSTYECPQCHWSKTVHPQSDALVPGRDVLISCPKCGGALISRPASLLENAVGLISDVLLGSRKKPF